MTRVTREDIVNRIFDEGYGRYTKVKIREIINRFFEITADELQTPGNSVKVPGFGVFTTVEKAPRKGRNILTQQEIEIPARNAMVFKPCKKLKESIGGDHGENIH